MLEISKIYTCIGWQVCGPIPHKYFYIIKILGNFWYGSTGKFLTSDDNSFKILKNLLLIQGQTNV